MLSGGDKCLKRVMHSNLKINFIKTAFLLFFFFTVFLFPLQKVLLLPLLFTTLSDPIGKNCPCFFSAFTVHAEKILRSFMVFFKILTPLRISSYCCESLRIISKVSSTLFPVFHFIQYFYFKTVTLHFMYTNNLAANMC